MTPTPMIDSTQTPVVNTSPAPRNRRSADVQDAAGVDAFAAMLDATRQAVQARTLAETRESPSQMFEAKGETRPHDPTDEDSERTPVQSKTPPVVQEVPASGTSSATNSGAPRFDQRDAAASSTVSASPPSTRQRPVPAVATSLDSGNAPPVENEASFGGQESGFARRNPSAATARSEANSPTAAAVRAFNIAPAVQNATRLVNSEATLARTVGEVLGGKGLDSAAAPRVESAARSGPSDRPTANRAAPPTAASSPPDEASKTSAPDSDNHVTPFERLVRSLRMQVGERYSTARMRLNPPELGEMRVDVRLRGDAVELEVRTMDEAARRIVAGRANELRSALEQSGVTVRRFDVMVDETMVATLVRSNDGSRAAATPKRKSEEAQREAEDRAGVRRALSRRGRLDVRG